MGTYQTKVLRLSQAEMEDEALLDLRLEEAAALLRAGEIVAFPTETVYGLGGLAYSAESAGKIYAAKGRPTDNPLIVHLSQVEEMDELAQPLPSCMEALIRYFSPGPITYIVKKKPIVPAVITGGLDSVALRIPLHRVARRLIARCGSPLAAPSANRSGRPSPTSAAHVWQDLQGRVPLIIDGGSCQIGLESSILDLTDSGRPAILRPGFVTGEAIIRFLEKRTDFLPAAEDWRAALLSAAPAEAAAGEAPKAPGMKYRHYAPRAHVFVVRASTPDRKVEEILTQLRRLPRQGRAGLFVSRSLQDKLLAQPEYAERDMDVDTWLYDDTDQGKDAGYKFFHALRELDLREPNVILVEALPEAAWSRAFMNRLDKAEGRHDPMQN